MKHIYKYLLVLLMVITSTWVMAQNQVVTGTVSDENGPIYGATVKEKNLQSNGVLTNPDGKFTLTLKGTSRTILVSFIGMQAQEVEVGTKTTVNVKLKEDAQGLDQIVVVGYGKQKKITLTGSLSTVSGAEIRQNPSASLQNTLVGRLPGFFSQQRSGAPGADGATFFVRGISSYNGGSTTPLIIVDDIEYSPEQFAAIDANEVENISILKDAATTAIYGVKGANGVVVVTTRRGSVSAPRITYRNELSIMKPTVMPEFLNSYETAVLFNQARVNDGLPVRFTPDDLQKYKDGSDPYGHPDNNWREILFKDYSKQIKGNFDVNGGTERVKYFISAGFLFQDGMLRNYGKEQGVNSNFYYTRYNYRSNLDIKATKTLDLRIDLYGNLGVTNTNNIGSAFGYNDIFYDYVSFASLAPFNYPVYNPDGTFGYSKWQRDENPNYNQNNIVGRITHYGYNRRFNNNMNLVSNIVQKLDFLTEGLSLKGVVSYASVHDYGRSMTRDQFPSFIYNSATNTYEPRDINIYRVRRYFIGYSAGSTIRTLNTQLHLNYDRTMGNHHAYGVVLTNVSSDIRFNSNVNYNFVPNNFRGYTGRVGYDYADKYLFQFNAAYNGSARFGDGKKYGFFPAVSAGWVISNEKFWKENIKAVDYLKLRGSFGEVGNDNLGGFSYFYQQNYNNGGNASFGYSDNTQTGLAEGSLANNEVTWETERKADLALEFGLFKSKLTGSIDVFHNVRRDILTTRGTVSSIFGVGLPPVNLGKVQNQGGEVELNYRDKIGNVDFGIRANYSLARNKILFQDEPAAAYPYQALTGNPIGQILTYKFIGFYTSAADIASSPKTLIAPRIGDLKYEDMNGDGKIDTYDMAINGYPNLPNSNYGLELRANYKGFGVTLLFQAATNFNVRGVAEAIQAFASNLTSIHQNSWTPELGDNAQYPLLSFSPGLSSPSAYPSTFWFVSGNYLRLKNAEVNYNFSKRIVEKLGVQNLRAYVNGYNLITWSNLNSRYQFDPESNSGADRIKYPPQQMINFGLSVTF